MPSLSVKSVSNQTLVDGQPYAERLVARDAGPNVRWILQLHPPGARISADGVVSWVARFGDTPAHFSVTAADDAGGAGGRSWVVTVKPAPVRLAVVGQRLDDQHELVYTPQRVEGTGPVVWSLSKAPDGMTIDPQSGEIRWPAVFTGKTITVTVKAKGPAGSTKASFAVDVVPASPMIAALPEARVRDGDAYRTVARISYGSGDMRWSVESGPAGLAIDARTGELTWAKAVWSAVPYLVRVKVVGPGGAATKAFQLTVDPLPPVIVALPPARVDEGKRFEATPTLRQGSGEIRWRLVTGPNGMQVDAGTGAIRWDATPSDQLVPVELEAEGPGGRERKGFDITVVSPPVLAAIPNVRITEGERYTQVIELSRGTGPIDFEVTGHQRGMYITLPKRTIAWRSTPTSAPVRMKVKAKGPTGVVAERTFTVEVLPRDDGLVQRCPRPARAQPVVVPQCCDFQLKLHCKHVVGTSPNHENQDIRAGSHGWAGFHGTPFAFVNPRSYTMLYPPAGAPTPNEKRRADRTRDDLKKFIVGGDTEWPVYQVLAGRVQLADLVTSTVKHQPGCPGDRVVSVCILRKGQSSSAKALSWTEVRPKATEAEQYGLVAGAEAEFSNVPLQGEWRSLVRYNPFRWKGLPRNQWDVAVVDESGAIVRRGDVPLRVTVEACSDIRWEVNVTLSRSSSTVQGAQVDRLPGEDGGFQAEFRHDPEDPTKPETIQTDSGWVLTGIAKVAYDQYVHSFEYQLADNLQGALGFLSTLDSAFDFLDKALSFAPVISGSVRKPSLSVYFAAEPYEQDSVALVGYQWKLGFGAKPLFGVQIEFNLLDFILLCFPLTSAFVPFLKALRAGVGVKGVARVRVDIGIYLIAGGEVGVELEWAYQQPDGHAAYGLIDARIDFKIEGRAEAELEVFIVSGGAGVKVGAKTAVGLCIKAASGDGPRVQGQTRWEGVVLYLMMYYKAGLKIGPFTKGTQRTKTKVLVVAKPRYWPRAPVPQ
ncbi:hypothetical protein [Paraliomyxa miuraensis]|uniref:hypothetical protein n=1 Tax=Paraliomyxa miuraensis TaxID=376150 RepID=UPI002251BCF5|nr:hypothetical protein [Paraliomyxa miuraensis]MCX4244913.1 hypothetical protein [Paraliomyxa miuraensis]